jgi:hypothetical protein
MLYVITDTLLKLALNTNKTGHHVVCYTVLLVLNATFNNMSCITYNMVASCIGVERHVQQQVMYNMVTSFIGVERHFQQCARCKVRYIWYIVESGVQHQ